jgi:1,2-diacylglycerol 3-alpha-glucosyltransferase
MHTRSKPVVNVEAPRTEPLKLALVSCGLGKVKRGFETSTDRWFRALSEHSGLNVKLFCGGDHASGNLIPNIPRDYVMQSPLALAKPFNRRRYWEFCYGVEQISFGFFFWPDLVTFKPDVVWTKEVPFGYFLPIYKKMFGLEFKTIFANGGAFRPATYKDFDLIQHLTQESLDEALAFGIPPNKMISLTNIIDFCEPGESREQIRNAFGYALDDFVVICVSAWNAYHKRLDYLINEVAAIADPRVKLLLCGHPDAETSVLKQLARDKLGDRVRWVSLPEQEVQRALKAADAFVLASLDECLGNAIAEAVMSKLPIVVHSTYASRFILGDTGEWAVDLSQTGVLRNRLVELRTDANAKEKIASYTERVHGLFSKDSLVPKFYHMAASLCDQLLAPQVVQPSKDKVDKSVP